jgi:hypothetical protein
MCEFHDICIPPYEDCCMDVVHMKLSKHPLVFMRYSDIVCY